MRQRLLKPVSLALAVVLFLGDVLLAQQIGPQGPREGGRRNGGDEGGVTTPSEGGNASAESAVAESTAGTVSALQEYANIASSFATEAEKERAVRFHHCLNIRGETLAQALENFMTPAGTVAANDESDLVVISDVEGNIELLVAVANQLDQPVAQVLVEARIVEFSVDRDFQKEVNVEFQKLAHVAAIPNLPGSTMDFVGRLTDAFVDPGSNPLATRGSVSYMHWDADKENLLTVFVRFLENNGRAKILSAPNLILRRGAEGSIITGEEVPIQTQTITSGAVSTSTTFKSVGIKLRVTPVMVDQGRIRLQINPEVSNVTRYDEKTGAPIIAIRSANTELEVGDGQLVSIGGLLRSEELERQRRVPILASIPLLGHLFRGTTKRSVQTQLVIFLRASVLTQPLDELPPLRNLDLPPDVQIQMDGLEERFSLQAPSLRRDINELSDTGRPEAAQE